MQRATLALIGIMTLAGCQGSVDSQSSTNIPPLTNIYVGDKLTVDGQTFLIKNIARDFSEITIVAYVAGFFQSSETVEITLRRQTNGYYTFVSPVLHISYDPITGNLEWEIWSDVEEDIISGLDGYDNIVFTGGLNYPGFPDYDNDGVINIFDDDDDNDGVSDVEDAFPFDPTEALDTDGDGIGNNSDDDDDNDGITDTVDSSPLDERVAEIGFAIENAAAAGINFLASVPSGENWAEGNPSNSDAAYDNFGADRIVNEDQYFQSLGYITLFSSEKFTYENINIEGLVDARSDGWTGLDQNIYILDYLLSDDNFLFYDLNGGFVEPTHGGEVYNIIWLIAPEANFHLVEYSNPSTSFSYFTHHYFYYNTKNELFNSIDSSADVINLSMGVHIIDSRYPGYALEANALNFVTNDLQRVADSLPNAVIVESAGNNGSITWDTYSYGCEVEGLRNTASSCTDIKYSLNPNYYDALDRTIFVGAYDYTSNNLADYSVSAGEARDHFIVADGNAILSDRNGTSFAAPRVTGALGLVSQKFPELSAQARKGLILDTASDLGATGVDAIYGHGALNLINALSPLGMLR